MSDPSLSRRAQQIEAELALGQMLLDQGRAADALESFRAAAFSGDGRALNMMGQLYEHGHLGQPNFQVAGQYYFKAAEKGDVWGMFNLADLHLRGQGVARDPEAAYALYTEAASRGHSKSLNMLGLIHEDGLLGPSDPEAARAFYRAGAAQGDCWAQFNLGRMALQAGAVDPALSAFQDSLQSGFPAFWLMLSGELSSDADPRLAAIGRAAAAKL